MEDHIHGSLEVLRPVIVRTSARWGCVCDSWKPSFLPRFIFNWCTFLKRVMVRWSRWWAKSLVLTNQNSRNSWRQIVRGTIWVFGCSIASFGSLSRGQQHSHDVNHIRPGGHREPRNEVWFLWPTKWLLEKGA